jgi:hypothetical protein
VKRSQSPIFYSLLLLVLSGAASTAMAEGKTHYRWQDERGNPVHSDRPPPAGIEYEVISTGSTLVRKVPANEGAVPAVAKPSIDNKFEQVETDRTDALKKNPEYCARAQENLRTLNTAARIRVRNDKGELYFLDEEQKQIRRDQAEVTIETHCD